MRTKPILAALIICSCSFIPQSAKADSLQLKNGQLIQGTYLGGTRAAINFLVNGAVRTYPVTNVMLLDFSSAAAPSSSAPANASARAAGSKASAPESAASSTEVTVPTGARLEVRMIDTVSSKIDPVGYKFKASLEQPLESNGTVVAPKGAIAYGELVQSRQAGTLTGSSELSLELTGLTVSGKVVPVSTSDYTLAGQSRGKQTAERAGVGAGLGAIIGALAGGGKGAAIGAAVGGGAGAASQVITRGQAVNIPSETVLDFTLAQPLIVALPAPSQQ